MVWEHYTNGSVRQGLREQSSPLVGAVKPRCPGATVGTGSELQSPGLQWETRTRVRLRELLPCPLRWALREVWAVPHWCTAAAIPLPEVAEEEKRHK